jgi:hypothetical protein
MGVMAMMTMCAYHGVQTLSPSRPADGPSASAPLPPKNETRKAPAQPGSAGEFNKNEREKTEGIINRLNQLRDSASNPPPRN